PLISGSHAVLNPDMKRLEHRLMLLGLATHTVQPFEFCRIMESPFEGNRTGVFVSVVPVYREVEVNTYVDSATGCIQVEGETLGMLYYLEGRKYPIPVWAGVVDALGRCAPTYANRQFLASYCR